MSPDTIEHCGPEVCTERFKQIKKDLGDVERDLAALELLMQNKFTSIEGSVEKIKNLVTGSMTTGLNGRVVRLEMLATQESEDIKELKQSFSKYTDEVRADNKAYFRIALGIAGTMCASMFVQMLIAVIKEFFDHG